jgi:hypothetical protein
MAIPRRRRPSGSLGLAELIVREKAELIFGAYLRTIEAGDWRASEIAPDARLARIMRFAAQVNGTAETAVTSPPRTMLPYQANSAGSTARPREAVERPVASECLCRLAVVYRELRVYSVKSGAMHPWVSEWRDRVYPLRVRLGFAIPAAWVVEGENRFVWLLEYNGDDYETANAAYYDSPERRAFDPDPARHLLATEHWPLRSVL